MAVGEWDHRQLCPDGSCIGVVGDGGTCKVCGRAAQNWGDERKRGLVADVVEDVNPDDDDDYDEEDEDHDEDDEDEIAPSAPAVMGQKSGWNERMLCPNGACVGVIRSDGTCSVCGTLAPAAANRRTVAGTTATVDSEAELAEAAAHLASTMEPADAAIAPALEATEAPVVPAVDDLEAQRKLCPDGACIGVIGQDSTCRVCGKVAT